MSSKALGLPEQGRRGEELEELGRCYRETGSIQGWYGLEKGPRKTLLIWLPAGLES